MAVEEEAVAYGARDAAPVEIRFAAPTDADALALLSQELLAFYSLPVHYQRSYMAHVIADKAFRDPPTVEILIATGADRAVGFLAFNETFALANCQNAVFIQDLFVTRKARTAGVGRRLMTRLAQICVERGVTQLDWTADPWNDKARSFYEAMGPLLKSEKMYYRLLGPRLAKLAETGA